MADNYLEKQMADYRAGKFAVHRVGDALARARAASAIVGRVVYVIGAGPSDAIADVVRGFRNGGCRVAFCCSDTIAGRRLAQLAGAQFHPLDPDDDVKLARSMMRVASSWAPIDIVVDMRRS